MVTRNECHRGNKHTMVAQARHTRPIMIKSAAKYPDRPPANSTTASPMLAAAPAKYAANSNIRAANRRPTDNKCAVARSANPIISKTAQRAREKNVSNKRPSIARIMANSDPPSSTTGKCGDSQMPSDENNTAWADSELVSTQLANLLFSCPGVGRACSATGFGATGSAARACRCAVRISMSQASATPHAWLSKNYKTSQTPISTRVSDMVTRYTMRKMTNNITAPMK